MVICVYAARIARREKDTSRLVFCHSHPRVRSSPHEKVAWVPSPEALNHRQAFDRIHTLLLNWLSCQPLGFRRRRRGCAMPTQ